MNENRAEAIGRFLSGSDPARTQSPQEDVLVSIRCYEPNSRRIDLTGEDLCRNTLFVGTVGSGKTTCMNSFLRDLISYRAGDPRSRVGLLIIDSKMDETADKVRHWAAAAGREDDLRLLSPTSTFHYDFMADLESFAQLDEVVDKICSAVAFNDPHNQYWVQGRKPLLDAALTIMFVTAESLEFSATMDFLRGWLMNPGFAESSIRDRISLFKELAQKLHGQLDLCARNKIHSTLSTIDMWTNLEGRTKSNWASVLANCLSPFMGINAQAYFDPRNRSRIDIDQIVTDGKIVVLSVNAARDPDLAKLIGHLIKADFYRAAQSRQIAYADEGRLVGLIMDEYPLVVTGAEGRYGDIVQLQSLRSKRAFVVAAVQGFVSLDMVIGTRARDALLVNFNNLFFLNSHEEQVDRFAQAHFGMSERSVKASLEVDDTNADGDVTTLGRRRFRARLDDWVCPPGRLSQLECNQAFVSLAGGRKFSEPLWIEPLYCDGSVSTVNPPPSADSMQIIRQIAREFIAEQKRKREVDLAKTASVSDSTPDPALAPKPASANAVERKPDDLPPCNLIMTRQEFERLWKKRNGIISRYIKRHRLGGRLIPIWNEQRSPAQEIAIALPHGWLSGLLKERAFNSVEKAFQRNIRNFLRQMDNRESM